VRFHSLPVQMDPSVQTPHLQEMKELLGGLDKAEWVGSTAGAGAADKLKESRKKGKDDTHGIF